MDFKSLEYFEAVAQELNFTKAAERLHMSQPPLSNAIKQLEEDLGVQLFIRGKRHLTLTPAGTHLLQRAEEILILGEETRNELLSLEHELSGMLRIGVVDGRAPYLVAQWIRGFQEEYPLVRYRLWNGSSDDVLDHMNNGLSDLGVIAAPYDSEHYDGIVCAKEPWVAYVPIDHPLAKQKVATISLKELARQPLIVPQRRSRIEAIRRWFSAIDKEPDILCEMSSYLDIVALVEQGVGVGIFPQTTYTPNPMIWPLVITDPPKIAEYLLVWRKGVVLQELPKQFVNYVRDFVEEGRMQPAPVREGLGIEIHKEVKLPASTELL